MPRNQGRLAINIVNKKDRDANKRRNNEQLSNRTPQHTYELHIAFLLEARVDIKLRPTRPVRPFTYRISARIPSH